MNRLSLADRADSYNRAFPQFPDSHLHASARWLQGVWILGNDYQGSGMYGSYPPGYLKRIAKVFPDALRILHLFSGSLPTRAIGNPKRRRVTLDIRNAGVVKPGVQASALALPFAPASFDLILADTPYSKEDATRYGVPMPNRQRVLREAWTVVEPGGFLVWMDTVLPMYAKVQWKWCGAIPMFRSTNHRVRAVMIFERMP